MARTETELAMSEIWIDVLDLPEAPAVDDNFFELGGHSLTAAQLIARVNEVLGVQVPLSGVFESPDMGSLAKLVDTMLGGERAEDAAAAFQTDLDAEVVLDPDITENIKSLLPYSRQEEAENILITGATGFLGAFVLYELLAQTTAQIWCLVRAKDPTDGYNRLEKKLTEWDLWNEVFADRIIPVTGDLALPKFGVSEAQWAEMAQEVDCIYHSASLVNFLYPYRALKNANVRGAEEVLRLAATERLKPVHFVSTLSTYAHGEHLGGVVITEDAELAPAKDLFGGYTQSKWVSEKVAMLARDEGLPVAIYRPGRITGHGVSGVGNVDDFMCRMI